MERAELFQIKHIYWLLKNLPVPSAKTLLVVPEPGASKKLIETTRKKIFVVKSYDYFCKEKGKTC